MMNSGDSLARGAAPASPGTLHVRSVTGRLKVPPRPGLTIRFGRGDRPEVDLPVAEDDLRVSRRHGELTYRKRQWWLRNTGQRLVRLPHGRLMHATTEPIPLAAGYTPVFVKGSGYREHLVELYVTGHEPVLVPCRQAATLSRATAIDRIRSAGAGGTAGGCGNGGTANPSPPPFTPAPSG